MVQKIARRITPDYLHNAALYYLGRYAASTGRLTKVLTEKVQRSCRDHPDQNQADLLGLVAHEIDRLQRVELLKDDQLAQQMVENYRARGVPTRMIRQKLQLKNFTPDVIQAALLRSCGDDPRCVERETAIRYLTRRKLWPTPITTPPREQNKRKLKAWAALARQGYDPDMIKDIFASLTAGQA